MLNEDIANGALREVGGKIENLAGNVVGDANTQVRGKLNQAAGRAQQAYGDATDQITTFTTEQPLTSLLMAAGFGVFVGLILGRR